MERGRAATRPWGAGTRECLCMFARVFVCVHAYMCACMYSCACLRACWCTHVYVRVCVHVSVCMHTCVCMHVCVVLRAATEQECCPATRGLPAGWGASAEDRQERRRTDRHWVQGGSRPQRRARGDAASAATSSHQSVMGVGWSYLLHRGVIQVAHLEAERPQEATGSVCISPR